MVNATRPGRFTPGKDPVPIVQEAGWTPVTVWTSAENLLPIGIRSTDRPARSKSLYRLSYRGPLFCCQTQAFLPASLGIYLPSQPFVTRIITYTITAKLQINTVDVSCLVFSQQTVVGGRSVVGFSYERPIFEGTGEGGKRHSR